MVFNPFALKKTKIVCNFGLSECNRVNGLLQPRKLVEMAGKHLYPLIVITYIMYFKCVHVTLLVLLRKFVTRL